MQYVLLSQQGIVPVPAIPGDIGFDEFEYFRPDRHYGLEYLTGPLVTDQLRNKAQDSLRVLPVRIGGEGAHDCCTNGSSCC